MNHKPAHPQPILNMPPLTKGQTIGIFAPSSTIDTERLQAGVSILHDMGFKTKIHPQTYAAHHQSAGTPDQKVSAFYDLLKDPSVDFIMASNGGNRAALMLPLLDFEFIRAHAKPLGGFSDVTILLNTLYKKAGITSFHMPTVQSLTRINAESLTALTSGLNPTLFEASTVQKTGTGTGPLLGGTLAVLSAMVGTHYMPDYTGAILFLEDVNEELSRIDRMLWQLRHALPFENLSGIIFGEFLNPADTGRPFGFTLHDIINEHTAHLSIPIICNTAIGHGERNHTLPFGNIFTLDVSDDMVALTQKTA